MATLSNPRLASVNARDGVDTRKQDLTTRSGAGDRVQDGSDAAFPSTYKVNSILNCPAVISYIAGLKPKNTEDPASLCSLLTRKVSHSTSIRLGNELESIINLYITSACPSAVDRRPIKVRKGEHQKDLLRELPNTVLVYAEFKSNINLDTEKRKATREKVNAVASELSDAHPDGTIAPYLVSLRYLRTTDIPPLVAGSYSDVTLIGIADFFQTVLGHPLEDMTTYRLYTVFLMSIVDRLEPAQ